MNIFEILNTEDFIPLLTENTFANIFKDPNYNYIKGINISEILEEPNKLYSFLLDHAQEIDVTNFLVTCLKNYKDMGSLPNGNPLIIKQTEGDRLKKAISCIEKLLQGKEYDRIYFDWSPTGTIEKMTVLSDLEVQEDEEKKQEQNAKRLEELKKDENFLNILQSLQLEDIEGIIPYRLPVGKALRTIIQNNTLVKLPQYGVEKTKQLYKTRKLDEATKDIPAEQFLSQMEEVLTTYIGKVNFDALLLCSYYRYIEALEEGRISDSNSDEVYRRLETILKHVDRKAKLKLMTRIDTGGVMHQNYSVKSIEKDMKRFVPTDSDEKTMHFMTQNEINETKTQLITGTRLLNSLTPEEYKALQLSSTEELGILHNNPENYILFLKMDSLKYGKQTILNDILNTGYCSIELLSLLCSKCKVESDELFELFEREIIGVEHLIEIRGTNKDVISGIAVFEKYIKWKETQGEEKAKAQKDLDRITLAYRKVVTLNQTQEEQIQMGEDIITEIGDKIESKDIPSLYRLGIIPLQVAVDWGGEIIIEELLSTESLKPTDAKYLYDIGMLDANVIKKAFINCPKMSYAYQFMIVSTIFEGQDKEKIEIRRDLSQYFHIEEALVSQGSHTTTTGKRRVQNTEGTSNPSIKVRDPGTKYKLLASIDKDFYIEEGITDGHLVFHFPNVGNTGTVLIEKMHKVSRNRQSGLIEIKTDNESATYLMSEEEFIEMKPELIKDGKIDRTQLTQRWWKTRDPNHWIAHSGISAWENALQERLEINPQNTRYTEKDLKAFEEIKQESIKSRMQGEEK